MALSCAPRILSTDAGTVRTPTIVFLLACLALGGRTGAVAAPWEVLRAQEIAQCQAGEIATWNDGIDRPAVAKHLHFYYSHVTAPAWFDEATVLAALERAAQAWSACGLSLSVAALAPGQSLPDDAIAVQWSETGSRHNFGLANFSHRSIALGPSAFQLLQSRNPLYDARQTLQMVIAHEMGHLLGVMAHSRRCVDVTSYYDDGRGGQCYVRGSAQRPAGVEYRSSLPTACDIQRCRQANALDFGPPDSAAKP